MLENFRSRTKIFDPFVSNMQLVAQLFRVRLKENREILRWARGGRLSRPHNSSLKRALVNRSARRFRGNDRVLGWW